VVWKEGVGPSYQLAVVLDDIAQGVDVVVRGDDLLASAARQELLYQAFAQSPPEWIHVPLVVGADGKRLAKRHGDTTLHAFRQAEWTAEEMIGWLAQSCGMAEEGESLTLRAWLSRFDWQRLPAETVEGCVPQR
ncbi:MAG: glutamate--tRNA ligase family protein, partial [Planctomycetes bacterium]|nr:glutamate--tRNA ligase family protein [Planctomycetota bacterium]